MIGQNRAVSSAVSYALVIAITLVLTAGLIVGAETLIENNREETVTQQLDAVGEQIATTLVHTDQLTATEPDPNRLNVSRQFPQRVAGSQYRLVVTNTSTSNTSPYRASIVLESSDFDVGIRTTVTTTLPIANTTVNGGSLEFVYNSTASSDRLEVRND